MFRALGEGEEGSGKTLITDQRSAIALNAITFEPSRFVTRAEYMKMIIRAL